MNTKFSCVGCGKCCSDHHVPLTLAEARMWAADGGAVIVLALLALLVAIRWEKFALGIAQSRGNCV